MLAGPHDKSGDYVVCDRLEGKENDMRQYETFELTFQGAELEGSWALADLKAEFTREGDRKSVV